MKASAPEELYERDFYDWTQLQARALSRLAASRPNNLPLDLAHLTEEIRGSGKEQRHTLQSWTARIMERLLLLQHSAAADPRRGWISEIVDFRGEIEQRLSSTLRHDLKRRLPHLYANARRNVLRKLAAYNEPLPALPEASPFTLDQVLGDWCREMVSSRDGGERRTATRPERLYKKGVYAWSRELDMASPSLRAKVERYAAACY